MIANGFDRKYSTCDKKFNHKKQWNLNSIWKKCTDFVSNIECPGSAAYVFFFKTKKMWLNYRIYLLGVQSKFQFWLIIMYCMIASMIESHFFWSTQFACINTLFIGSSLHSCIAERQRLAVYTQFNTRTQHIRCELVR